MSQSGMIAAGILISSGAPVAGILLNPANPWGDFGEIPIIAARHRGRCNGLLRAFHPELLPVS